MERRAPRGRAAAAPRRAAPWSSRRLGREGGGVARLAQPPEQVGLVVIEAERLVEAAQPAQDARRGTPCWRPRRAAWRASARARRVEGAHGPRPRGWCRRAAPRAAPTVRARLAHRAGGGRRRGRKRLAERREPAGRAPARRRRRRPRPRRRARRRSRRCARPTMLGRSNGTSGRAPRASAASARRVGDGDDLGAGIVLRAAAPRRRRRAPRGAPGSRPPRSREGRGDSPSGRPHRGHHGLDPRHVLGLLSSQKARPRASTSTQWIGTPLSRKRSCSSPSTASSGPIGQRDRRRAPRAVGVDADMVEDRDGSPGASAPPV